MIKAMFVGGRAAGVSREAAMTHLLTRHGPMVVCAPEGSGMLPADYVQNHVFDGVYPASGPYALERDLATQFWFHRVEDMQASGTNPYYLANLQPDEPRFVDRSTVGKMRLEPKVVLDGERGSFKLLLFVTKTPDATALDWARSVELAISEIASAPGATALVDNTVGVPPEGERFVDHVLEAWLDTRPAAAALLTQTGRLLELFAGTIDRERSFALAAEEFPTARIRALHLAKGQG